jgi:hypothetical protein
MTLRLAPSIIMQKLLTVCPVGGTLVLGDFDGTVSWPNKVFVPAPSATKQQASDAAALLASITDAQILACETSLIAAANAIPDPLATAKAAALAALPSAQVIPA